MVDLDMLWEAFIDSVGLGCFIFVLLAVSLVYRSPVFKALYFGASMCVVGYGLYVVLRRRIWDVRAIEWEVRRFALRLMLYERGFWIVLGIVMAFIPLGAFVHIFDLGVGVFLGALLGFPISYWLCCFIVHIYKTFKPDRRDC